MSRPRKALLSYLLHKQSGQAIVTLTDAGGQRRDVRLGKYDTPESRQEHLRVIGEWEASVRRLPPQTAREELDAAGLLDTRAVPRRQLRASAPRGACLSTTQGGTGVRVEIVPDANGAPIAAATAAANVAETALAGAAVASIPTAVEVPDGVPLIGDRA